jgi:hypothetical protein
MSAQMKQVDKMFSRLSGAGKDILAATKDALKSSTVQMILGAVLILYVSFLESESESVLSLALSNPLGRIMILLLLVVLTYSNPILGVLFVVLIVMSFVSVGSVSPFADYGSGCSATLGEGFQDDLPSPAEQGVIAPAPGGELEKDTTGKQMGGISTEEGFMNFQDEQPTPADGLKDEGDEGEEGFLTGGTIGKHEYSLFR